MTATGTPRSSCGRGCGSAPPRPGAGWPRRRAAAPDRHRGPDPAAGAGGTRGGRGRRDHRLPRRHDHRDGPGPGPAQWPPGGRGGDGARPDDDGGRERPRFPGPDRPALDRGPGPGRRRTLRGSAAPAPGRLHPQTPARPAPPGNLRHHGPVRTPGHGHEHRHQPPHWTGTGQPARAPPATRRRSRPGGAADPARRSRGAAADPCGAGSERRHGADAGTGPDLPPGPRRPASCRTRPRTHRAPGRSGCSTAWSAPARRPSLPDGLPAAGGLRPQIMATIDYRDLLDRLGGDRSTARHGTGDRIA